MPGRAFYKSGRFIRKVALIVALLFTAAMGLVIVFFQGEISAKFFTSWYAILASMLLTILLLVLFRSHYKEPDSLTFTVFGLPRSGKTVFLQMLLHRLKNFSAKNLSVTLTYDQTGDPVHKNIGLLMKEQWLPRSVEPRDVSRISVTLGTQLLPDRFRVQIVDYNFQRGNDNEPVNASTVNRSGALRGLGQSDGVIFILDGKALLGGEFTANQAKEELYIAAVKEMQRMSGGAGQMNVPAALVITKIDYVETVMQPSQLTGLLKEFVGLCKRSFKDFRIFYVSSVGKLSPSGMPHNPLSPRNVVEPFVWMMRRFE